MLEHGSGLVLAALALLGIILRVAIIRNLTHAPFIAAAEKRLTAERLTAAAVSTGRLAFVAKHSLAARTGCQHLATVAVGDAWLDLLLARHSRAHGRSPNARDVRDVDNAPRGSRHFNAKTRLKG